REEPPRRELRCDGNAGDAESLIARMRMPFVHRFLRSATQKTDLRPCGADGGPFEDLLRQIVLSHARGWGIQRQAQHRQIDQGPDAGRANRHSHLQWHRGDRATRRVWNEAAPPTKLALAGSANCPASTAVTMLVLVIHVGQRSARHTRMWTRN